MAEQRQPFRFRLPWFIAPQPAPAASRPSQAPSQPPGSQVQRPPFRPAGVAQVQPPVPTTAEPLSPSASSQGKFKPAPLASLSQTVPQIQVSSEPVSPAKVILKLQQETKALSESPSPSRAGIRPKATAAQLPKPSQENLSFQTKKPSTITGEISPNPKDIKKQKTLKQHSADPKPEFVTATPLENVVEQLEGPNKQPSYREPKTRAFTQLAAESSSPKQEPKPQKQMLKNNNDKPKKESVIDREVVGSKAQAKAQPLAVVDGQVQHSEEDIFDLREVFKKIETSRYDTGSDSCGHERVTRFPHKHGMAGGQKAPFHKEIKENLQKYAHNQVSQLEKHLLQDKPLNIVTLTGKNIGATMHLGSDSLTKEGPIHIHRGYKTERSDIAETTDVEGSSRKRTNLQEELATKSYINNNAQGINNSLVFSSTMAERNPGVHVILSNNHIERTKPQKEREMLDAQKVEVTSTPAKRLAYVPTIRRRCLQSLLLESSYTDPEKPRRQGCPIGCTRRSKDGTSNAL